MAYPMLFLYLSAYGRMARFMHSYWGQPASQLQRLSSSMNFSDIPTPFWRRDTQETFQIEGEDCQLRVLSGCLLCSIYDGLDVPSPLTINRSI